MEEKGRWMFNQVLSGNLEAPFSDPEAFFLGLQQISRQASKEELKKIHSRLRELFPSNALVGHCLRWPYGYAGDFEVIDRIYIGSKGFHFHPVFGKYDELLLNAHLARATLFRKDYFVELGLQLAGERGGKLRILNIASGPCRDVLELCKAAQCKDQCVEVVCVDMDPCAIAYAKCTTFAVQDQVTFLNADARKLKKSDVVGAFDLVWCAGMFDYFDDQAFISTLSLLHSFCDSHRGRLVIGNQGETDEVGVMKVLLNWRLRHRSREELLALFKHAELPGLPWVEEEKSGLNHFLNVELGQRPRL